MLGRHKRERVEGEKMIGLPTVDNDDDDFALPGVNRGPHHTMNVHNVEAIQSWSCPQTKHDNRDECIHDDDTL